MNECFAHVDVNVLTCKKLTCFAHVNVDVNVDVKLTCLHDTCLSYHVWNSVCFAMFALLCFAMFAMLNNEVVPFIPACDEGLLMPEEHK